MQFTNPPSHNTIAEGVTVYRKGIRHEDNLSVISHASQRAETIGSVCTTGIAIHLTREQSKALRKALKAAEKKSAR